MQCWVRFYGLPREYWHPKNLFTKAKAVSTVIAMDDATYTRAFGHFAQILIDIDLSLDLCKRILVERPGHASYIDLVFERLPKFCFHYKTIGHAQSIC